MAITAEVFMINVLLSDLATQLSGTTFVVGTVPKISRSHLWCEIENFATGDLRYYNIRLTLWRNTMDIWNVFPLSYRAGAHIVLVTDEGDEYSAVLEHHEAADLGLEKLTAAFINVTLGITIRDIKVYVAPAIEYHLSKQ